MATDIKTAFWASLFQASDGMVRFRICMSILFAIAAGVTAAIAPLALKTLFDEIGDGTPISQALPFVAVYLLLIFVTRVLAQVQTYLLTTGEQRLQQRLAACTFEHVLALPMDFHLQNPLGAVLRAHTMMLQGVRLMMVHIAHTLLPISVQLVAVIVVVATLFNSATWIGLAVIAIAYASVFAIAAHWQSRATILALAADTRANSHLTDGLINIEPIKIAVGEGTIGADFERALEKGSEQWRRASARRSLTGLAIAAVYVAGAAMLILLATSGSAAEAVSVGGLVLLFTYLTQIFAPLESAGYAFQDLAQAVRYFDDWRRIANVREEDTRSSRVSTGQQAGSAPPEIAFKEVVLTYGNGREVLSGLSFDALPGQVTAIVGSSGAGKTSIVRALMRYLDAASGEIRIDGVSTRDMFLRDLRSQIAVVSQDTILFHATLRTNLLFPQTVCSTERLEAVLQLLCLNGLVARLPDGLETVVGERGQQLSGGERQRVAIARALLRNAPILILDEPTSALDSETEEAVRVALFSSSSRSTSILITHRLDLAAKADKIVLIANGKVEEEGHHDQLLTRRGPYARLWREHQTLSPARMLEHEAL